jgi:hypothetical protein
MQCPRQNVVWSHEVRYPECTHIDPMVIFGDGAQELLLHGARLMLAQPSLWHGRGSRAPANPHLKTTGEGKETGVSLSDNPFLSARGSSTASPALPVSAALALVALWPPPAPARAPSHRSAPSPTVATAARSACAGQSRRVRPAADAVGSHT